MEFIASILIESAFIYQIVNSGMFIALIYMRRR